jgi:dihydrofolate reductase
MKISLIVAIAKNNAIGKDNDLLWRLPNDMQYFKIKTLNHHVVTGRKNYISIPKKFRPLVDRTNIVLTRQKDFKEDDCIVLHSLEDAIDFAKKNNETELFIIGGGQIYNEALSKGIVDKMYITHVDKHFEADTFFPEVDSRYWNKITEKNNPIDDKHPYSYSFVVYEKIN